MSASLRALLAEIIDYAGLFPPARLPLGQAIRNYARHRAEPESWLLGRFICPAARLAELTPFGAELFQSSRAFVFSVLGRGGSDAATFLAGLRADLEAVSLFRKQHGDRVRVDVLEVCLPPEVLESSESERLRNLLTDAADLIESHGPSVLTPYYEGTPGSFGRLVGSLAEDARSSAGRRRERCRPAGFKLRCGGLEAAAIPAPERVAAAITVCRNAGVPLKFTAGLHHPLRQFDTTLGTRVHGFLNVIGGAVLAHCRHLHEDQLQPIIEDEDSADFIFDDGFRWQEVRATLPEISGARQHAIISFGSCSFDEPRDGLRKMGLLNED
jgi:hypothetical protein